MTFIAGFAIGLLCGVLVGFALMAMLVGGKGDDRE